MIFPKINPNAERIKEKVAGDRKEEDVEIIKILLKTPLITLIFRLN